MSNIFSKILVILLILVGESTVILAEMLAARKYASASPFLSIFLKMFLISIVGGGFLVAGYALGFKNFKNIWIVSVISITSILIMEPILIYLIFHQLPERGSLIGFIFGVLGFAAALFL